MNVYCRPTTSFSNKIETVLRKTMLNIAKITKEVTSNCFVTPIKKIRVSVSMSRRFFFEAPQLAYERACALSFSLI